MLDEPRDRRCRDHAHGAAAYSDRVGEHDEALRAAGLRATLPRRRVLEVLADRAHLTPDEIARAVPDRECGPVPPSTVYRALDALEGAGLVDHTHLDHGPPTYHLADHEGHLHLVCRTCGTVTELAAGLAADLAARLRRETGFDADLTHMAIHGRCASCADELHRKDPAT